MAIGASFTRISDSDGTVLLVKTKFVGRVDKAEVARWEAGLPEFRSKYTRYATLDRSGGHKHIVGGVLRHFSETSVRVHDVLRMCAFAELDLTDVDASNALIALQAADAAKASGKGPGTQWTVKAEQLVRVLGG